MIFRSKLLWNTFQWKLDKFQSEMIPTVNFCGPPSWILPAELSPRRTEPGWSTNYDGDNQSWMKIMIIVKIMIIMKCMIILKSMIIVKRMIMPTMLGGWCTSRATTGVVLSTGISPITMGHHLHCHDHCHYHRYRIIIFWLDGTMWQRWSMTTGSSIWAWSHSGVFVKLDLSG